jgi:uncharacterized Zn finger protein
MPECPDCGGELEASEAPTGERGRHRVYECTGCNELFEIDEIHEE